MGSIKFYTKITHSVFLGTCLFFLFSVNLCTAMSNTGESLFGGGSDDIAVGIVQTEEGGYVIAATTYSFGAGSADFLLIKLDQTGNIEWNMTYGGPQEDTASKIVQTNDEGYALIGKTHSFGTGNSSYWIVKVDSQGNMQWNQTYGQTTSEAKSVIQTSDKGYAVVGVQENDSNSSVWMVKTDEFGNMQWNRTYEDNSYMKNVYSIIQSDDGGYVFAGATNAYSEDTASDAWIVKTDSEGIMQWTQTYDMTQGFDYANALIQTNDSGYTFSGTTGGFFLRNAWIVRTDENGNTIWNTVWHTAEPAYINSLIQTNDEGYIATGTTDFRNGYFHSYMFMIKVDINGNIQWNSTYDGLGDNKAFFAIQTTDGGYALAGTTKLTDENANYDIWFAKVDPSGEIIPEFPSWNQLLILGLVAVFLMLIIFRQRIKER